MDQIWRQFRASKLRQEQLIFVIVFVCIFKHFLELKKMLRRDRILVHAKTCHYFAAMHAPGEDPENICVCASH